MIWQLPDQQEVVLRLAPSEALGEVRQTVPAVTVDRLAVIDVDGGMSITAPRRTWRGAVTVTVRTSAAADGCTRVTLRAAPGRFIDHGFACAVAYLIADWLRASRSYVADAEPAELRPRLWLGDPRRPESGDTASGIIGD
jgi:hypothetical protein